MTMKFFLVPVLLAATPVAMDWEQNGRPLPVADQEPVALDERLTEYRPCRADFGGAKDGSVATILPDLFKRWSASFARYHPGAPISSAPPFGPPQGRLSLKLTDFLEGKSDFALVSRDLTEVDRNAFRRAHGQVPIVIPVANGSWRHFGFVDTVVVIVHKDNPIIRISFAQIDAMFSSTRLRGLGEATDWGSVGNRAWAGRPIEPVGGATWLNEDSARSSVIRSRVLNGGEWRADLAAGGDEASAIEHVAATPNAIAITGLGHISPGVRALAISASEGEKFVAPTFDSVRLGHYPLSRTIDLLLRPRANGVADPVMAEFSRFILSREGQQIVVDQGVFLPLRASQVSNSLAFLGRCEPA